MEILLENVLVVAGGLAFILAPITQAIKNSGLVDNRYITFIPWILGMVLGALVAMAFDFDVATYVLAGLIAGTGSNGLYDGYAKGIKGGQ